jgi:alkylation response protein AidB-like acyl-CoA dehydrogenase
MQRLALTAHQLHGGIGYSTEYRLHHYTDRIRSNAVLVGSAAHARLALGNALLDGAVHPGVEL